MTISLYSTANSAPLMTESTSAEYPLVRKRSDFSTRCGVSSSPSRAGSSPSSPSSRRIVSCILTFYLLASWPIARARRADPEELYRQRENFASARQAAEIWAGRAASGQDFEAAWKLARISYWLGTHGDPALRRAALERGIAAGTQAATMAPNQPEGHFWLAADMGALAESFGLSQGLKYRGRIKSELELVLALDDAWLEGSGYRALGWWYHKVPALFGGSQARAEQNLRKALTFNPTNVVTLYFLGEVLADQGKRAEAALCLRQAVDAGLHPDFGPEDRDFKRLAAARLDALTVGARRR
jgi:tetratricopeptide (TPR) repeat protein